MSAPAGNADPETTIIQAILTIENAQVAKNTRNSTAITKETWEAIRASQAVGKPTTARPDDV
jgi:hypothetical protein